MGKGQSPMTDIDEAVKRLSDERDGKYCLDYAERLDDIRTTLAEIERLREANEKLLDKFGATYQTVSALVHRDIWSFTADEEAVILDHLSNPEAHLDEEYPRGRSLKEPHQ